MLRGESVSLGKLADEHHAKTWTPPKITLKQIRAAIPDHCFERNTLTSLAHVVADGCLVGALAIGATNIQHFPIPAAQPVLWLAYWIAQGTFFFLSFHHHSTCLIFLQLLLKYCMNNSNKKQKQNKINARYRRYRSLGSRSRMWPFVILSPRMGKRLRRFRPPLRPAGPLLLLATFPRQTPPEQLSRHQRSGLRRQDKKKSGEGSRDRRDWCYRST